MRSSRITRGSRGRKGEDGRKGELRVFLVNAYNRVRFVNTQRNINSRLSHAKLLLRRKYLISIRADDEKTSFPSLAREYKAVCVKHFSRGIFGAMHTSRREILPVKGSTPKTRAQVIDLSRLFRKQ
jgi:hypothetical protein